MKTENKQGQSFLDTKSISHLFDFQHFKPNARMTKIVNDVESRYGTALSDDDLCLVSAAGEGDPTVPSDKTPGDTKEAPL